MKKKIKIDYRPTISTAEAEIVSQAIDVVCEVFGVERKLLMSSDRYRYLTEARFAVFMLSREYGKLPFATIGKYFGKDHSTVIHGINKNEILVAIDKRYASLSTQCIAKYIETRNIYHIHEKMALIGFL
jgi:chromosomal replication initiation ATPase DnaA